MFANSAESPGSPLLTCTHERWLTVLLLKDATIYQYLVSYFITFWLLLTRLKNCDAVNSPTVHGHTFLLVIGVDICDAQNIMCEPGNGFPVHTHYSYANNIYYLSPYNYDFSSSSSAYQCCSLEQ